MKKIVLIMLLMSLTMFAGCNSRNNNINEDENTVLENSDVSNQEDTKSNSNNNDDLENSEDDHDIDSNEQNTNEDNTNNQDTDKDNNQNMNNEISDKENNSNENFEIDYNEFFEYLYSSIDKEFPKTMITYITSENMSYYIGIDDLNIVSGMASEPMINAIAHSIVLIELKPDANIEEAITNIKDNVDPRKWICVSVDEENVIVDHYENYLIVILDQESQIFHEAFKSYFES